MLRKPERSIKGREICRGRRRSGETKLGELLRNKKVTMATAESCTGGYIAHLITSIAGVRIILKGSVVSYANEVKVNVLGVNAADLEREELW